jgi:hypothetical protein
LRSLPAIAAMMPRRFVALLRKCHGAGDRSRRLHARVLGGTR